MKSVCDRSFGPDRALCRIATLRDARPCGGSAITACLPDKHPCTCDRDLYRRMEYAGMVNPFRTRVEASMRQSNCFTQCIYQFFTGPVF